MSNTTREFLTSISINHGVALKARHLLGDKRKHSSHSEDTTYVFDSKCGIWSPPRGSDTVPPKIAGAIQRLTILTARFAGMAGDLIICGEFEEEGRHVKGSDHGQPFRAKGRPCLCYENITVTTAQVRPATVWAKTVTSK